MTSDLRPTTTRPDPSAPSSPDGELRTAIERLGGRLETTRELLDRLARDVERGLGTADDPAPAAPVGVPRPAPAAPTDRRPGSSHPGVGGPGAPGPESGGAPDLDVPAGLLAHVRPTPEGPAG